MHRNLNIKKTYCVVELALIIINNCHTKLTISVG